jgi:hypothetical protein
LSIGIPIGYGQTVQNGGGTQPVPHDDMDAPECLIGIYLTAQNRLVAVAQRRSRRLRPLEPAVHADAVDEVEGHGAIALGYPRTLVGFVSTLRHPYLVAGVNVGQGVLQILVSGCP